LLAWLRLTTSSSARFGAASPYLFVRKIPYVIQWLTFAFDVRRSKCISRKQKAAGSAQPPISCVAQLSCDAQAQNYFFFFAFFFFAFFAMVELLC
jgi:hypothetical protein